MSGPTGSRCCCSSTARARSRSFASWRRTSSTMSPAPGSGSGRAGPGRSTRSSTRSSTGASSRRERDSPEPRDRVRARSPQGPFPVATCPSLQLPPRNAPFPATPRANGATTGTRPSCPGSGAPRPWPSRTSAAAGIWMLSTNGAGYGQLWANGERGFAHRGTGRSCVRGSRRGATCGFHPASCSSTLCIDPQNQRMPADPRNAPAAFDPAQRDWLHRLAAWASTPTFGALSAGRRSRPVSAGGVRDAAYRPPARANGRSGASPGSSGRNPSPSTIGARGGRMRALRAPVFARAVQVTSDAMTTIPSHRATRVPEPLIRQPPIRDHPRHDQT